MTDNMLQIRKYIYLLITLLVFAACEDDKTSQDRVLLGFTPRTLSNFEDEGGYQKLVIKTNQSWWDYVVEGGENWATVIRDVDTLYIATTQNKSLGTRQAQLVITIGKGENQLIRYFPIKQVSAFSFAFDIADLDANGWLWFDTQAKIDKYVGPDKFIQIYGASFGDNEQTIADPTLVGADDVGVGFGETDSEGNVLTQNGTQKTGGIRLAMASKITSTMDGGSIEFSLKSCNEFSLSLSSNSSMQPGLYLSTNNGASFDVIKTYAGSFFGTLAPAGQTIWGCHTERNNALQNIDPIKDNIVRVLNIKSRYLYIHGIKLLY